MRVKFFELSLAQKTFLAETELERIPQMGERVWISVPGPGIDINGSVVDVLTSVGTDGATYAVMLRVYRLPEKQEKPDAAPPSSD